MISVNPAWSSVLGQANHAGVGGYRWTRARRLCLHGVPSAFASGSVRPSSPAAQERSRRADAAPGGAGEGAPEEEHHLGTTRVLLTL